MTRISLRPGSGQTKSVLHMVKVAMLRTISVFPHDWYDSSRATYYIINPGRVRTVMDLL
jgi:hypothetical protein